MDGENKIFHGKVKFKQYLVINPVLQKVLEGKLQYKKVNNTHENTGNNLTPAKPKEGKHTHNHNYQQNKTTLLNNHCSLIISQHLCTQFSNKMTHADRTDMETGSIILLHTRNIPQHQI